MPFRKRHTRGGDQIKKQIYNETNDLETLDFITLNVDDVIHEYRFGPQKLNQKEIDEIEDQEGKETVNKILRFIDTVWSDIGTNLRYTTNKNVKYTLSHNSEDYIILYSKNTVTINYRWDGYSVKYEINQWDGEKYVPIHVPQSNADSIDRIEGISPPPNSYHPRILDF